MNTKGTFPRLILLSLVLKAAILFAQAPNLLNYQGKLTEGGNPVNGNPSMTFAIYSTATGGTALWTETQSSVQVTNGVFNVLLGSVTPFGSIVFGGSGDRYLGITISGREIGRFRLASAGFAVRASQADNVPDGSITGLKVASATIGINHLNFSPLTASTDYGRSGVTSILYEGTTPLSSKYFSLSGGSISGNVSVGGSVSASANGHGMNGQSSGGGFAGIVGGNSNTTGNGVIGVGNGVGALILPGGSGGAFTGSQYGIVGFSRNTSGSRGGGFFGAVNAQGSYDAYVAVGVVTAAGTTRKLEGTGTVNTVMATRSGMKSLFAPESPEAWFEDIGRGQLSNGHARIELDPLFLDVVSISQEYPINVFIQLNDDCNGVYVKSNMTGFEVHELQNGKSSAAFTYKVIAKWKGYEKERFPQAIPPASVQKAAQ